MPLLYPQLLTFPLVMSYVGSADCPWPALGTVHLANRIEQTRSLKAGDAVRVELQTGTVQAHEKGQVFTLDLRILQDDESVWSATQTLLRVGVQSPSGKPFVSGVTADAPLSHQARLFRAGRHRPPLWRGVGRPQPDPPECAHGAAVRFSPRHCAWHVDPCARLACVLPQQSAGAGAGGGGFQDATVSAGPASLWTHRTRMAPCSKSVTPRGKSPTCAAAELLTVRAPTN